MLGLAARADTIYTPKPLPMSIRRPRGPKPTLKHLAFLEAMTKHAEPTKEFRALRAALLTLRLFDEWMSLGTLVADGAAPIVRATRADIDALHDDSDLHFALSRIVDGILMLREPDASPVLPRLAALAELYGQRAERALADSIRDELTRFAAGATVRISSPTEALA